MRLLERERTQSSDEGFHRQEETTLRSIFASSPDAIAVIDLDENITECNQATLDMLGYSLKDEIIGKNGFELVAKKDRERAKENLKILLEQGSLKNIEYTALTEDGREFSAELSASVIEDASGNPTGFVAVIKDITERKRVEEALRESEEKFRNIFESANDCMIYLDRSGRILDVNRKAIEVFSGSKKELLGKHFTRVGIFSLKDMPALGRTFANILAGKEDTISIHIKNKKGQEIPLECSASLMKTNGKITGVMVIARDTTERKKAEEELRFLKEFNEGIVHSIGDALLVIDPNDYTIITANETALKQLKLRKEDLIGKTCYEATHHRSTPCKPPHHTCPIQEMLRTGKSVTVEHKHFDKDNKEFFVEVSARPVKNQEGKIVHFVHLARDITERKKAEEKIRESEERYRVLVESAADAIFTLNEAGDFLSANQEAARAMGKTPEDIIGKNMYDLFPKDIADLQMAGIKAVFQTGNPLLADETLTQTKFGRRWYSTTLMPIRDSNGKIIYVMGIARDTTERKKMEEQLKEYAEHLEEMVEERTVELKEAQEQLLKSERLAAVGEVATMVGHDLRNPLQSIENATYYLNNELSRFPPSIPIPQKTMEMLQVLNDSVNYADKIIRDLQEFSATPKPTLEKTNINAIVKDALSQVKAPGNVKLITKLGHTPEIKADKDMIKRAFLNLAINGIQAMDKGGTLKVSTKKTKGFVEVSFKDTGAGMSKEEMDEIFTPFFTTKAKGMGMGLPICKKFVDAHGGSIEVKSKEGKGSTFTVKLPIQQENGGEKT